MMVRYKIENAPETQLDIILDALHYFDDKSWFCCEVDICIDASIQGVTVVLQFNAWYSYTEFMKKYKEKIK